MGFIFYNQHSIGQTVEASQKPLSSKSFLKIREGKFELDFNQIYNLSDNKPAQEKIKMSKPLYNNEKRSTRELSLMQNEARKNSFYEVEFKLAFYYEKLTILSY